MRKLRHHGDGDELRGGDDGACLRFQVGFGR